MCTITILCPILYLSAHNGNLFVQISDGQIRVAATKLSIECPRYLLLTLHMQLTGLEGVDELIVIFTVCQSRKYLVELYWVFWILDECHLKKPIIYPIGILKNAPQTNAAKELASFLQSEEAMQAFAKYGFARAK